MGVSCNLRTIATSALSIFGGHRMALGIIALQTVVCRTPVSPVNKIHCTFLGFIHFEQWI